VANAYSAASNAFLYVGKDLIVIERVRLKDLDDRLFSTRQLSVMAPPTTTSPWAARPTTTLEASNSARGKSFDLCQSRLIRAD